MAKKEDELFKEWVKEVSDGLETEDEKKAFEVFSASKAGRETLRGGMRRAEFDRRLNDLHETRRQLEVAEETIKSKGVELKQWYEEEAPKNTQLVNELNSLKAKLREVSGDEDAPPAAAAHVAQLPYNKEEYDALKRRLDLFDQNLPRLMGEMASISKRSIQEGFDVDPRDVIAYASKNRVDPFRAYEDLTHEARQEKFESDRELEKKKWKEEGRKEALSNMKSSPDHIRTPGPSVVDSLFEGKAFPNKSERVNAAVRDYLEMGSPS